ncbi:MAG TPA: hypothetical protein DEA90_11430 [Opitutae bacterium]|nr:hypothetical protein [Puniceicoccaceae bacterium]HBR94763.1 hypothetical protein [Opitutae bacterium]
MEFLSYKPLLGALLLIVLGVAVKTSLVDRPRGLKWASAGCRMLAVLLLLFALCRPYWSSESERLHVVFLLDASESIEATELRTALAETQAAIQALGAGDSYSLFLFGNGLRAATDESIEAFVVASEQGTSDAEFRSASRLGDALLASRLSFPSGKARRVVVFSDAQVNGGNLADALSQLAEESIDVRFRNLQSLQASEAALLSFTPATPFAFKGEVVRMRVAMRANTAMPSRLRILHQGVVHLEQAVQLPANDLLEVAVDIEMLSSGASRWTAELVPEADHFLINNQIATTVEVKGEPHVLVIHEDPRQMRSFDRAMKQQGIELDVRGARGLPDTMEGMLAFDAIILADVAATDLRPLQMDYLKRYVTEFGGGLAMFGSENSFGLGGYYRSAVEEVLPLSSRFEKEKQKPSLAMVLVIDKSGSMSGVPIALARQAAKAAAELLNGNDQIAVIGFDSQAVVICEMTSASNQMLVASSIDSLQAGGGTNLQPGMQLGQDMLDRASTRIKHMIILSDGQTGGGQYEAMAQEMANRGVTISTVALGQGAARELMQAIAQIGKGRYYETNDPNSVPTIFTKETMQASKSAIKEDLYASVQAGEHPILSGYERSQLPMVLGYVMTRPTPTAQVLLVAETGDPLLAVSRFGLGTGLAYTSDLTDRWGSEWLSWPSGSKFWAQVIRGILKKESGAGMSVQSSVQGERMQVQVLRQDPGMRPVNQLSWRAEALDERGQTHVLELTQSGLGQYAGELSLAGLDRLVLNIRDLTLGRSQVLRWQRSYPAEYRLGAKPAPELQQVPAFTPATIRDQLVSASALQSATPVFVLSAMFLLLLGIVLRRV